LLAQRFEKLGDILVAPGYSDERIHLFMATDLMPSKQNLDEDEVLTTEVVPLDHAMEMMENGEIQDAMTMIGLHMAHRELKRRS
jgi:ADP-ribose pyrophosphatase